MVSVLSVLLKNSVLFAVIGLLQAAVGAMIPDKYFENDVFPYTEHKWEHGGEIYQKLFHVGRWKGRLPDASRYVHKVFCKKKIETWTHDYLCRFIRETRRAEFSHYFLILMSPIFFLWNTPEWGEFMAGCSILGNIPFIIVQRYNRHRLIRILKGKQHFTHSLSERIYAQTH